MSQKGTSRTTFGCFFIKYRSKRGRRPKAAALFWERPKAAPIFDEKASKSGPGGTCLTHFDSFLMFSCVSWSRPFQGIPGISKIHHFHHFSTFSIGPRKCPKKHLFDEFWGFPDFPFFDFVSPFCNLNHNGSSTCLLFQLTLI